MTATEGSVEKTSEKIKYRSYIPEEIEAKVTEVLNKADFSVVPSFEAGLNSESFKKDYITANNISDITKKAAVDKAKEKGLNYLAIGVLDVGREDVDAATGSKKVYVSFTGYVLDLKGKFSKRVASIGPVQYSGLGENPTVAKINALNNAATAASKDLVDQLRVKQAL